MNLRRLRAIRMWGAILLLGVGAGCGKDATGLSIRDARLERFSGDAQFGLPSTALFEPLQVRVVGLQSGKAIEDISVEWRLLDGAGASVTPISVSDEDGRASASVTLGPLLGTSMIEARIGNRPNHRVVFEVRAVGRPRIDAVTPGTAVAGETVSITGANFSLLAAENTVRFGAFEALVEIASATQLQVRAPRCLPGRPVDLSVSLGAVESERLGIQTVAADVPDLALNPGQGFVAASTSQLDCLRVPIEDGGAFLLVAQNAAPSFIADLRLTVRGVGAGGIVAAPPPPLATAAAVTADWELALRERERMFEGAFARPAPTDRAAAVAVPQIGERREFSVLTAGNEIERIDAEVRAVTNHAILYEDLDAPAGGLTAQDFASLGAVFDDPIRPTVTAAFGLPSDIDENDRVIILFTPRVNKLTPRGQNTFIVGFFFGCDLLPASRCADTNLSEIFYSFVPDPGAQFGDARSKTQVLQTVPSVLAHEFQHMISFVSRNQTLDDLWLSEALAHSAEDIVADEFVARGDQARADQFRLQNYNRASRYLESAAETSLVGESGTGTLEMRGGAWLLIKYLMGHYGGTSLLGALTRSAATGSANISGATGQPWRRLLGEFAVALWADDAPDLAGTAVETRFTFTNIDLRSVFGQGAAGFPLKPVQSNFGDFAHNLILPPASHALRILSENGGSLPPPLHMTMTRMHGAFTADEHPGLAVLRIR